MYVGYGGVACPPPYEMKYTGSDVGINRSAETAGTRRADSRTIATCVLPATTSDATFINGAHVHK